MVEILAAAAIGSVAILGLSTVFERYRLTQRKVAAVLGAAGAEVDLVLQLENPKSPAYLDPTNLTNLRTGGDISGMKFQLHFAGTPVGGVTPTNAIDLHPNNTLVYFRSDGTACADFSSPTCTYSARLKPKFDANAKRYQFAYEINVNPLVTETAPLGDLNKYTTYAPNEAYQPVELQQCDTAVPPVNGTGDIGIRGINRSTGQAYCIKKPTSACQPGTFPMGTKFSDTFTTGGTSGGSLEMICTEPPAPAVSCGGEEYVLQQFGAGALGTSGTCVFRTKSPQAWPTVYKSSSTVKVGRACPKNYHVVPHCKLTSAAQPAKVVTCGKFTNNWTSSCQENPKQHCEESSLAYTDPDTVDTNGNTIPGVYHSAQCTKWVPDPSTFTQIMNPSWGGGPDDFRSNGGVTVGSPTMFGDNSFECKINYPNIPWHYKDYTQASYQNTTNLGSRTCDGVRPQWEKAEMTVTFECVLTPAETVPADSAGSINNKK